MNIYTREDAEFLVRNEALPAERVIGVETGGCPHTAIRDDTSMNLAAIAELEARHPAVPRDHVQRPDAAPPAPRSPRDSSTYHRESPCATPAVSTPITRSAGSASLRTRNSASSRV